MKRTHLLLALLPTALVCAGCVATTVAPVAHVVMKYEGNYVVLEQSVAYFDNYAVLEIEKPVSGMGEGCPKAFLDAFEEGVTAELLKKPYFSRIDGKDNPLAEKRTGPTLLVRSAVVDYSMGKALNRFSTFGPDTYVVVRAELVDSTSGSVICIANVRGVVKSAVHGETADLVHGVGKGLARLFHDHHAPVK